MNGLPSTPVDLPLPVIWTPTGPFVVEIDDPDVGFDPVAIYPDLLSAARKASRLLNGRELRGDARLIRLNCPAGSW